MKVLRENDPSISLTGENWYSLKPVLRCQWANSYLVNNVPLKKIVAMKNIKYKDKNNIKEKLNNNIKGAF